MNTNILRVYIELANPILYELVKEYEDILRAERPLQKHEKKPSCHIVISDTASNYWEPKKGENVRFDIRDAYDSRLTDLFPKTMAEINPYLRFMLRTGVPEKKYKKFEKQLIKKQEEILQGYAAYYLQINECYDNESSLYESRKVFQLRENKVLWYETKLDQTTHPLSEADRNLEVGRRDLFSTFTN